MRLSFLTRYRIRYMMDDYSSLSNGPEWLEATKRRAHKVRNTLDRVQIVGAALASASFRWVKDGITSHQVTATLCFKPFKAKWALGMSNMFRIIPMCLHGGHINVANGAKFVRSFEMLENDK